MLSNWLTNIIETIHQLIWGLPSIILLVGTGLYLTFKLRFIQIRAFKKSINCLIRDPDLDESTKGQISRFQALSTGLSSTVGTGNIAGVATAITLGGPGAIFWMWISALAGMATKFASSSLAVKYRKADRYGIVNGGPMYTIKYGIKKPWLGVIYAIFTIFASFGVGSTVQANSIVGGLEYVIPAASEHHLIVGFILAFLAGMVIIGGIKRIATVAAFIVPFMALAYCSIGILILFLNASKIPAAFSALFNLALNPKAAGAGAIGTAMRYGIARGIFSNEAGLGSSAIAHAAARVSDPIHQGLIAMLEPFIDTIIICTMTALVIIIAGNHLETGLDGAALSADAFANGLSILGPFAKNLGSWIVGIGLIFFAYTTIIAWSYYSTISINFLFGPAFVHPFRFFFIGLLVVGAVAPIRTIWSFADIANMLMAIPNLFCVLFLSNELKEMTKTYFKEKSKV